MRKLFFENETMMMMRRGKSEEKKIHKKTIMRRRTSQRSVPRTSAQSHAIRRDAETRHAIVVALQLNVDVF